MAKKSSSKGAVRKGGYSSGTKTISNLKPPSSSTGAGVKSSGSTSSGSQPKSK